MSHQLINQTSGNTEWYTPSYIIDAARGVMGGIDLDPASSESANRFVGARVFFAKPGHYQDAPFPGFVSPLPVRYYDGRGGLAEKWYGRVWLNHPFGNSESICDLNCKKKACKKRGWHAGSDIPGSTDWIQALVGNYQRGHTTEALTICYAATSEDWFKPLKQFPMCLIDGRTNYIDPVTQEERGGVTKGSVVVYLGKNVQKFADEFGKFGSIMVPYKRDYYTGTFVKALTDATREGMVYNEKRMQ